MIWSYILIAYAGLFSLGIIDNGRGPIYPEILKSFNLTNSEGSLIFSLASLACLIANILAKWWLPKFGTLKGLRYFLLIQAIGCYGIGISSMATNGYQVLILSSIVFGLSLGGMGVTNNLMMAQGSTPENRRKAYSGLHSMYGVSSLIAPLLISYCKQIGISWGQVFQILSLIPLTAFIASFLIKRIEQDSYSTSNTIEKINNISTSDKVIFSSIFAFYVAAEISISTRMILFLRESLDFSLDKSSIYLSAFFFLLLLGRMTFAFFNIKISSYKIIFSSLILSIILYLFGIYKFPILLPFCGLTMSVFFPCAMEWMSKIFNKNTDKMTTIVMTSVGVMLITMHWIIGQLASKFGIMNALLVGPLFLTISLSMLFAKKDHSSI